MASGPSATLMPQNCKSRRRTPVSCVRLEVAALSSLPLPHFPLGLSTLARQHIAPSINLQHVNPNSAESGLSRPMRLDPPHTDLYLPRYLTQAHTNIREHPPYRSPSRARDRRMEP